MAFDPGMTQMIHSSLRESTENQMAKGEPAVLLLSQSLRSFLARMVRHAIPELHVLSYDEVPDDKQLKVIASIGAPQSSLNG